LRPTHVAALADVHDGDGDCWFTPPAVLDAISNVLGEWGDPCADPRSPAWERAAWRIDVRQGGDGLRDRWGDGGTPAFVNPPFSGAAVWLDKCRRVADGGLPVIVLCPARVETRHWDACVWSAGASVVLPVGRLRFVGADGETHGNGMVALAFIAWDPEVAWSLRDALLCRASIRSHIVEARP